VTRVRVVPGTLRMASVLMPCVVVVPMNRIVFGCFAVRTTYHSARVAMLVREIVLCFLVVLMRSHVGLLPVLTDVEH